MEQNINIGGGNTKQTGGKKVPLLKITKGKLGTKTKKKDNDDEQTVSKDKMQQREIRGMEEMHWKVFHQMIDLHKTIENFDKANIFDFIYEPMELYCDVRKRY